MRYISLAALVALSQADSNPPSCGAGQGSCPEQYPCCSTEGTCGNGYVCLGGCDPRYSNTPGSCVAMPVYNATNYTFQGTEGVATYSDYLGDAVKDPFNYLGNITTGDNNALRIQLFQNTGGSTVSSSAYLWYGKTTIKMKTSGSGGVISDFILLSSVKDEIDYEFVGYDENNAQSNYYWQGQLDYQNMVKAAVSSNTEQNYHEYTIDWQENQIQWIIDGNVVRTLNKEDTKNSTTGAYSYPQTPCRLQFGLWPGGDSSAQGTSEWAGGKVNWDQAQKDGYFYVDVESISVEPYDAPANANKTGSKSYIYTNKDGLDSSIAITDDDYVLLATDGTGDNLAGPYGKSSSAASSSAASSTRFSSSSASSSAASSSSASSSSVSSSAVSSSSASSSSASSSSASSSSSPSSSASSSSASSSSASSSPSASSSESSSDASSSSSEPSSTADSGVGAAAGGSGQNVTTSSDASQSATSSASSQSASTPSASSSAPAKPSNGAGSLIVPAVVAIIPAFLLL